MKEFIRTYLKAEMRIAVFSLMIFIFSLNAKAQSSIYQPLKFATNKDETRQPNGHALVKNNITFHLIKETPTNTLDFITHELVFTTLAYAEEGNTPSIMEDIMIAASLWKKKRRSKLSFIRVAITDFNYLVSSNLFFKLQLAVKL